MANPLFPRFPGDPDEYLKAERFWQAEWDRIALELNLVHDWTTPWLNTSFGNGKPFGDGNPIFSAVCQEMKIGIRIIQLSADEDQNEFTHWINNFGGNAPDAIQELVIAVVPNQKTCAAAIMEIRQFVVQNFMFPRAKKHADELGNRIRLQLAQQYLAPKKASLKSVTKGKKRGCGIGTIVGLAKPSKQKLTGKKANKPTSTSP